MKTDLAYIDDVMDRAISAEFAEPKLADNDRKAANTNAKKLIGGFRVHDADAERKAIDGLIAKRRESISKFRTDRDAIRDSLGKIGIAPLAVCPTGAWFKICRDAGLFVLSPDAQNRIRIDRNGFNSYAEKTIDKATDKAWGDFLKKIMPDGVSLASGGVQATVILPDPPADVVDILVKAQTLKLTVAAVGDAIQFAEKPSDLMKAATANPKDVWAREQGYEDYQDWLKRDPIIFTEHGTATAIIAQFGDFPIEKVVVDAAVGSDALLATKPTAAETVTSAPFSDMSDLYERTMRRYVDERIAWYDPREEMHRRMAERDRYVVEQQRRAMMMSPIYDSKSWTG